MVRRSYKLVWETFGRSIDSAQYTSIATGASEKAAHEEQHQTQLAQFTRFSEPRIEEGTYSRIARQEEYKRSDKKWSWAP
jgi:hypothetical protein